MSETEKRLKNLLDGAEFVSIEVINTNVPDCKTGSERIRLVSGVPEYDLIISKLRDALC